MWRHFICALAVASWPGLAAATLLFDWDLDELARRSDLVVVGTVEARATVELGRTLMTDTRIRIKRTLAGEAAATITVRQLGGRLGDRIVDVPGDAVLKPGRDYLLFTARSPQDGRRYLVGMALGALEVEGGQLIRTLDVPLIGADGAITPGPGRHTLDWAAVERALTRASTGARR